MTNAALTFDAERIAVSTGLRVNALSSGSGDPATVLLHGLGDCGLVWRPFLRAARPRGRVIALDLPGHGDSDRPRGQHAVGDSAAHAAEVLEHLRVGSVVLIGHSMGAQVAIHLASHLGDRVTRVVLVDGGAFTKTVSNLVIRELLRTSRQSYSSIDAFFEILQARIPVAEPVVLAELAPDMLRRTPDGAFEVKCPGDLIELLEPSSDASLVECLEQIRAPTLVVRGSRSSVLPLQAARKMLEHLAEGVLVNVPAGHCVPLENPEGLAAVVEEFLGQDTTEAIATRGIS